MNKNRHIQDRKGPARRAAQGVVLFLTLIFAAGPAPADTPIDFNKPVEIDADALEVFQEQRFAVFTGNVTVSQGGLVMRSKKLKVSYGRPDGSAVAGVPEVTRIDAQGKVHVVSPDQSVRGDWAVYDVSQRLITMGGDVILTRGDNILRGNQLTYNLITGQSRFVGQGQAKVAGKAAQKQDRVRAVFAPFETQDKN